MLFHLVLSSFIALSRVSLCHFSAQPWFRFAHRFPFTAPQGKVMEQWKQTAWAKRLETRQKRAQMTDFERFKLRMAKRVVSFSSFFIFVLSFSLVISFSLLHFLCDSFRTRLCSCSPSALLSDELCRPREVRRHQEGGQKAENGEEGSEEVKKRISFLYLWK